MLTTQLNNDTNNDSRPVDVALAYAKAGIPTFPCRAADEVTDRYDPKTGEIIVFKEKSPLTSDGFNGATKNVRNVSILFGERHPAAIVGMPTGAKLGAWVLDLDRHGERDGHLWLDEMEAIHGPLPETARASTANGGTHVYFKHVDGVRNRGAIAPGVDTRGDDGYVIAPGSIMADGRRYKWMDDWEDPGLPPIAEAPQWLLDLVVRKAPQAPAVQRTDYVYEPGGSNPYVESAISGELERVASAPVGNRGHQLFASACAIGEFVAAGAISRSDAERDLYAAAQACGVLQKDGERATRDRIRRGLDKTENSPRHIPEPTHDNDNTPVNPGAARRLIESAKRKAANDNEPANDDWAQETLARLVETYGGTIVGNVIEGVRYSDQIGKIRLSGYDIFFHGANGRPVQISADGPPATDIDCEPEIEFKLEDASDLESLTYPGGLVQDLIDWIVSSTDRPSRPLALAAVLPFVASLAGPRFATGIKATRPNIYVVALAESGFGKDHARSRIKTLFMESEGVFDRYCGPERIMSASALREVLEMYQTVDCQIDEFGGFLRDITDRTAGMHQRAISTDLRDYYSASASLFGGAAYKGNPAKKIYNPHLCIHGTSTPGQFWDALASSSAEDGLLPRLVLFHIRGSKPKSVTPEHDVYYVPEDLLLKLADVAGINVAKVRASNLGGIKGSPTFKANRPTIVPWDDGAHKIFSTLKQKIEELEDTAPEGVRPFINRILETTTKLALIVAIGTDPASPEITEPVMRWAVCLAWTCAATMIAEVGERLSDNQREANHKRISAAIKKAGAAGLSPGRLANNMKSIDKRQRDEIIEDLRLSGHVKTVVTATKGRSSSRLVWFEFET